MKKTLPLLSLFMLIPVLLAKTVSAHCPLCTAGAGVAAGVAVWLGVAPAAVALFIGGFGVSMGMWFARIVKKKYIPFQSAIIIVGSFLLTVIPILPIIGIQHYPLYLTLFGGYGSFFNSTYLLNLSWIMSFVGGGLVFVAPKLNKKITEKRGRRFIPFQGIVLTLLLLIVFAVVVQFGMTPPGQAMSIGSIENLSPAEFENLIQDEKVFLLNTHTPYEGEIEGTDLIIEDWENVEKYMDKLPVDTTMPIAIYCRSGRMSGIVAEELKEMGYTVYNLEGGMNSWKESQREILVDKKR